MKDFSSCELQFLMKIGSFSMSRSFNMTRVNKQVVKAVRVATQIDIEKCQFQRHVKTTSSGDRT